RHDVGQQVLMDDLDAAVDDGNPHAAAIRDLPGSRDVEILARGTAALAGVLEVPLRAGQRIGTGERLGRFAREIGLGTTRFVQARGIVVVAAAPAAPAGGQDEGGARDGSALEALRCLEHLIEGWLVW